MLFRPSPAHFPLLYVHSHTRTLISAAPCGPQPRRLDTRRSSRPLTRALPSSLCGHRCGGTVVVVVVGEGGETRNAYNAQHVCDAAPSSEQDVRRPFRHACPGSEQTCNVLTHLMFLGGARGAVRIFLYIFCTLWS